MPIIDTGYKPRPLQQEIHNNLRRFSCCAIHRRFGKTYLALNQGLHVGLAVGMNPNLPMPRVSFISPLYKQSKTVAWDYLKAFCRNIPNAKAYESELKVDIKLSKTNIFRFQLFGADNPDALRGMYHDYAIFDEFGNQPPTIWSEVVSPALADRKGGALFLGTPNGKNHFYDMYQKCLQKMQDGDPDYYAASFPASQTGVIPEAELAAQRENQEPEEYAQEFEVDWQAAVRGSYYSHQLKRAKDDGRITRVLHESKLPVFAVFDLGTGADDYTACWFFQCFRNEIRLINFKQWKDVGLEEVFKDVSEMPYIYAQMILPWDGGHRDKWKHQSTADYVEEYGYEVFLVKRTAVNDGITAVRQLFSQCLFDEVNCREGLECLENYSKKVNPKNGEFMDTPLHDKFSHGADAFRYLALAYDPYMGQMFIANSGQRTKPKVNRAMS